MSKKTKIILIIVGIIILLCLCSAICLGAFSLFINSAYSSGKEINDGVLTDVCNSRGNFGDTEYKAWFTSDYREDVHLLEAQDIISDAFPDEFDCTILSKDNVFDMLFSGHSVQVSIENGVTKATVTFPKDESEYNTFELKKVGNEWEIDLVAVTKSSG